MSKQPLTQLPLDRVTVAPSILAADFARLGEQVQAVAAAGADLLHIDIMDGHFVPNLSMGPGIVESLRPHSRLPFDVHLMITHPDAYAPAFIKAGADHITFHVEASDDIRATLAHIHALGCSAGLSLKPGTPAEAIYPYLDAIDLILVMTVEPGFGGQSFMADMMPKLRALADRAAAAPRPIHIEVDGGINAETARTCIAAGATMIVAGTSVFRHPQGLATAVAAMRG